MSRHTLGYGVDVRMPKRFLAIAFVLGGVKLAFVTGLLWLAASAGLSVFKAGSDACGSRMKAESVIAGDWFCLETAAP